MLLRFSKVCPMALAQPYSQVMGLGPEPNASTARVAMQAGVIANLLRRWIKAAGSGQPDAQALLAVVLREAPKRAVTAKAIAMEAAAPTWFRRFQGWLGG